MDRSLKNAAAGATALGVVLTAVGLGVLAVAVFTAYPQFRLHFLAFGSLGVLGPGLLSLFASHMLRQRQPAAVNLTLGAAAWQAVVAVSLLGVQFYLTPISPVPLLLCLLWLLAAAGLAWQVLGTRAQTRTASGFEVV
jgi:hypothetical protein